MKKRFKQAREQDTASSSKCVNEYEKSWGEDFHSLKNDSRHKNEWGTEMRNGWCWIQPH